MFRSVLYRTANHLGDFGTDNVARKGIYLRRDECLDEGRNDDGDDHGKKNASGHRFAEKCDSSLQSSASGLSWKAGGTSSAMTDQLLINRWLRLLCLLLFAPTQGL